MRLRPDPLILTVAGHAAVITFILAAQTKDLVSSPTYGNMTTVAQPFAFGRCVPMTTTLEDEMVISYDEAYGEPVYRCTGWRRPWLEALLAAIAASLLVLALKFGFRLLRRSET